MLILSLCENFWDITKLGKNILWADVSQDNSQIKVLNPEEVKVRIKLFNNKRVLMLIHGFNDSEHDIIKNYFCIVENIQKYVSEAEGMPCYYDEIIGFVWPGYGHFFDYYAAEKKSVVCGSFLKELIEQFSTVAQQFDVLAHSMGNLLLLEALNYTEPQKPLVNRFYSIAPAVNDGSINYKGSFSSSIAHISTVEVFYSKNDPVEKWLYLNS